MSEYVFRKPAPRSFEELLEPGDYHFIVSEVVAEPYLNPKGHWVLKVKLAIQPSGIPVHAAPWSGTTADGEERNGIGEFLMAINRAPADGTKPNWDKIVGGRGKAKIKTEDDLNGIKRNRIHYFYIPKQVGPTSEKGPKNYSQEALNEERRRAEKNAKDPDLDVAPDDIPF